jgi:hypothetical protein
MLFPGPLEGCRIGRRCPSGEIILPPWRSAALSVCCCGFARRAALSCLWLADELGCRFPGG